jgi:diaminohydroxyphosphoribosylaminopyrimidine deaminase/5-amino-6-(5-phosphoribosylamino)uracil reductase
MRRAIILARRAAGSTSPNPPVGAVVTAGGRTVGEGFTRPAGGPHAEVVAIEQAGQAARGATLHVTLEPCAHHGRTPPCTDAIIRAGIARVQVACRDPNPAVDGRGASTLRAAGVAVDFDAAAALIAAPLIAPHAKYIRTGRPFVTAKFAASLDGRIATRSGDSKWITGPEARRWAHRTRATVDAIIVGIGTVLADDPELTARPHGHPQTRQPLRVVLDSGCRTPSGAAVLRAKGRCLVMAAPDAPEHAVRRVEAAGGAVVQVPRSGAGIDLNSALSELAARGCINILMEGGAAVLGSCFDAGLVDRVEAYLAPVVIGGTDAPGAVAGRGPAALAGALRLHRVAMRRAGDDLVVTGYTTAGEESDVHGDR